MLAARNRSSHGASLLLNMNSPAPARSIDDFLEQLYQNHKRRLPNNSGDAAGAPSSNIRVRRGGWHPRTILQQISSGARSICQCRHYLPLPLLALCIANSSDATEILMLSYLLAHPTFQHDMFSSGEDSTDASSMEGAEYLAASIFLGMLLGGTLMGFLSDHIGRRPSLLAGLLTNAIAGLLSSFPFLAPTIVQLTIWRFIAGIGIGATVPSLFSLASEWSPKEVRGAMVTFVASFWMVGSLFVSGLAWLLFKGNVDTGSLVPIWRLFAALCALPSALGACMVYCYVPESPRFLASSLHKYNESAQACNQMAAYLGIQLVHDTSDNQPGVIDPMLQETDGTGYATNTTHSTTSTYAVKAFTENELQKDYTSRDCIDNTVRTSRLRQTLNTLLETLQNVYSPQLLIHTTLPLQTIWFSLSFGTYGITTWINTLFVEVHLQNIYFNSFLFALANLPGNIMSIMYSDKWGRKKMLIGSLIGAAGGLAVFAILVYCGNTEEQSTTRTSSIVLSACMFQMFSIVSWNAIDILTGELFPTRVRSAGMGVCTACGRFGAMFAQFANAKLMMSGGDEGTAYVLVAAASTILVGAGMTFFLERDMALGELKDELTEEMSSNKSWCCCKTGGQKDHLSDDEIDRESELGSRSSRNRDGYQSFRQEEPLLL